MDEVFNILSSLHQDWLIIGLLLMGQSFSIKTHICSQPDNYRTTSIFAFHNNPVGWVLTNSSEFAIFNTPQPYSVTSDETWSRFISLHWAQD